jgi:hypothetical protein
MSTKDANQVTADASAGAAGARASTPEKAAAPVTVDATKKGKRKYTRGLRDFQKWERGYAKASRRIGQAIAAGLDTYLERRDRSSYKRRDGAIRDALKNWSKGITKSLRKASGAPYDLFKAINTKPVRRTVKFAVRSLALPFLR